MINEVDRVGLGMLVVDLGRANTSGVVNGGILEAAYFLVFPSNKSQELNIHLDMVTKDLFMVTFGVDFAKARSAREPV